MRQARTFIALGIVAALSAVWLAGPSSASGPGLAAGLRAAGNSTAAAPSATVESLVRYLPRRRLPVQKRIAYRGVCTADCNVTARTTLVLPGPNLGPVQVAGSFSANQVFEAFIKLNGPALRALKQNRRVARLRTRISAADPATGDTDVDRRTFRFKHG